MKIDDVYLFVLKIWHETRRTDGDISHSLSHQLYAEVNKISKKTQQPLRARLQRGISQYEYAYHAASE